MEVVSELVNGEIEFRFGGAAAGRAGGARASAAAAAGAGRRP